MQPAAVIQPVENKQSRLLTYEENQQVNKLLGTTCQALVTSVVQLFDTHPPHHTQWGRRDAGVLCFVKDNQRKNYFFRFYCIKRNKLLWEHELYNNMEYIAPCEYLQTFEAEECMICFNFANEDEAKDMKAIVDSKLFVKRRREEKRKRNTNLKQPHSDGVHRSNNVSETLNTSNVENISFSKGKRRRNITKADIGNPLDFKHVSHVGWHPDKGFAVSTEDTALTELFAKAGVSENQLKDKNTRDFIYDFISKHDQQNIIKDEVTKARRPPPAVPSPPSVTGSVAPTPASPAATGLAGPPVPPRGGTRSTHNRVAPPPPPSVTQATPQHVGHNNVPPPRPATTPKVSNLKSIPPPPPSNAPAAPPPPPMLPAMGSAMSPPPPPIPASSLSESTQPDGRSALLESIRSGAALKPVAVVAEADKRTEDSRGDLLSEIRKGFQLKPATEREVKPISPGAEHQHNGVNDLAAALSRALAERNRVIHPDDDSESSDSNDDWDD